MPDITQRLLACRQVNLQAQSLKPSQMRWNYRGHGQVAAMLENGYIVFRERLTLDNGGQAGDQKRWRWLAPLLTLERWREGRFQEIFCFELRDKQFVLQQPHYCGPDVYAGELKFAKDAIDFRISIDGPRKREVLHYCYS